MQHPLNLLSGLGEKRIQVLEQQGIRDVESLLEWIPRRYLDRTKISKISELEVHREAQVIGKILRVGTAFGRGARLVATLADETGEIDLVFFNQIQSLSKRIVKGSEWLVVGRVGKFGRLQMVHPELETLGEDGMATGPRIVPVYPSSEAFKSARIENRVLRKWISQGLELSTLRMKSPLPSPIRTDLQLKDRLTCLRQLHVPVSFAEIFASKRQLKIEEMLPIAMSMAWKRKIQRKRGRSLPKSSVLVQRMLDLLPFDLTEGQKLTLDKLQMGMAQPYQYQALVQGDVGSGKTAIAALALCQAIEAGWQGVLLAPTEILARQHGENFAAWFEKLGLRCELLLGSTSGAERRRILGELAQGECQLLIGTHAVFSADVEFHRLGLVIIDEQHRFGVAQRQALLDKGIGPDLISLSATPIPRSLAMTWYGDMESVVMAGKPIGRKPIQTRLVPQAKRASLIKWVGEQLALGERIYWVAPKVGLDEPEEGISVTALARELQAHFPGQVGLVHGQLSDEEKIQGLQRFKSGEIPLIAATTVIEVGVNVPEANVMVIEGAERFGLSQLHQLRGRVGRGQKDAWCFLLSQNEEAQERLLGFTNTEDGFAISEMDLELRGAGDLMGQSQSGQKPFKFFDFVTDMELIVEMREYSEQLLDKENPEVQTWLMDLIAQNESLAKLD